MSTGKQSIFILRHGDRWDYSHKEWIKTAKRPGDPSLSTLGHNQAREAGKYLDNLLSNEKQQQQQQQPQKHVQEDENIILLSSPFLRCIQTSNEILSEMSRTKARDNVKIRPEYSIFELDGHHGGRLHDDLPSLMERKQYFPRLDEEYESLFVPSLPESREEFVQRCDRSIEALLERYAYRPDTAIVIVTHAAGCIALTRALCGKDFTDIRPAAPCAIYRLTRESGETNVWDLDEYDDNFEEEGRDNWNGFTGHLSDLGEHTIPWNHFGPKSVDNGYSGPPLNEKN